MKKGQRMTQESRLKLSKARTGIVFSEEHKQNISKAVTGRKHTLEARQKIAEGGKDRFFSEASRQKKSISLRKQFCKHGHDTHKVGRQASGCLLCRYLRTAKTRGVPFELTQDQFIEIMNRDCIYKCSKCNATGIDQIIAGKGYVVGNVQPMCGKHNQMKNDFEISEFETLSAAVHSNSLFESSVDLR